MIFKSTKIKNGSSREKNFTRKCTGGRECRNKAVVSALETEAGGSPLVPGQQGYMVKPFSQNKAKQKMHKWTKPKEPWRR